MIGLTKSLSPLAFERAHAEPEPSPAVTDEKAMETAASAGETAAAAAIPAPTEDTFPTAPADAALLAAPVDAPAPQGPAATPGNAVVLTFPAVAKVTVVAAESEEKPLAADEAVELPLPAEAAEPLSALLDERSIFAADSAPPVGGDGVRDAITAEAISAIEADIATLLSSLDREELELNGDAPIDLDDHEDDETQVSELLSELDRLWQADAAVGAGRSF